MHIIATFVAFANINQNRRPMCTHEKYNHDGRSTLQRYEADMCVMANAIRYSSPFNRIHRQPTAQSNNHKNYAPRM